VTPDRTARGSGNWDPNSFLSREDMEAEIGQLKKSVAQLQEEKLRLKTSHVRMELEMAKAVSTPPQQLHFFIFCACISF
jgi:hypothetical protein